MAKALVRISTIIVSVYFIVTHFVAQTFGIDISSDWYATLFAFIIAVYTSCEGNYHCRFMKYTAWGVFLCDLVTRLDNQLDLLSVKAHNLIPITLLSIGLSITIGKAVVHFVRANRINNRHNVDNGRSKSKDR